MVSTHTFIVRGHHTRVDIQEAEARSHVEGSSAFVFRLLVPPLCSVQEPHGKITQRWTVAVASTEKLCSSLRPQLQPTLPVDSLLDNTLRLSVVPAWLHFAECWVL